MRALFSTTIETWLLEIELLKKIFSYELLIFWMYVIDLGVYHFMFLSHVIKPDP